MGVAEDAIEAKAAELDQAREALANLDGTPGTSSMRGKVHGQRIDANVARAARLSATVTRLEQELAALRKGPDGSSTAPTPDAIAAASFVRTKYGWYEVVKANRCSVKVKAAPGMDDLIAHRKILEAR
jgi:hypothetical protein